MQHLPHPGKEDLLKGAHVCQHYDDGNAVKSNQFGEQIYIKRRKSCGGMKFISTNAEQVTALVNSFLT